MDSMTNVRGTYTPASKPRIHQPEARSCSNHLESKHPPPLDVSIADFHSLPLSVAAKGPRTEPHPKKVTCAGPIAGNKGTLSHDFFTHETASVRAAVQLALSAL